jgi:hypothetical protein
MAAITDTFAESLAEDPYANEAETALADLRQDRARGAGKQ